VQTPQKITFKKSIFQILIELSLLFIVVAAIIALLTFALYGYFFTSKYAPAAELLFFTLPFALIVIPYTVYKYRTRKYWFEIVNGNTINEYYDKGLINSLEFLKIGSITSGGAKGDASSMIRELPVVIRGIDKNGALFDFRPRSFPSLTKVLLKFKKNFPGIQINTVYRRDISVFYHKQLFGEVDKERLFLLIVLLLGLVGLPLFLVVYSLVTS